MLGNEYFNINNLISLTRVFYINIIDFSHTHTHTHKFYLHNSLSVTIFQTGYHERNVYVSIIAKYDARKFMPCALSPARSCEAIYLICVDSEQSYWT